MRKKQKYFPKFWSRLGVKMKKMLDFTGSLFCTINNSYSIEHTKISKIGKVTCGYSHDIHLLKERKHADYSVKSQISKRDC
jgi:hypothetical protein